MNQYQTSHTHNQTLSSTSLSNSKQEMDDEKSSIYNFNSKYNDETEDEKSSIYNFNSKYNDDHDQIAESKPSISTFKLKSKSKHKTGVKVNLKSNSKSNSKSNTKSKVMNFKIKSKLIKKKSNKQPKILKLSPKKINGKFYPMCQLLINDKKTEKFIIGLDINISIFQQKYNIN